MYIDKKNSFFLFVNILNFNDLQTNLALIQANEQAKQEQAQQRADDSTSDTVSSSMSLDDDDETSSFSSLDGELTMHEVCLIEFYVSILLNCF